MLLSSPPLGFSSLRKIPFPLSLKKSPRKNVKANFCVVLEEHRNINSSSIILLDDDFRVLLRETQ